MSETATVEKVGNGFVVEFHGQKQKRVALDAIGLAEVFDEWPEASNEQRVTSNEVKLITVEDARAMAEREPSTPAPHPGTGLPSLGEGRQPEVANEWPATVEAAGSADVERWPTADDGTEYPAVFQGATANHFEMECPSHGRKRLERAGTNWRCTGKEGKDQCRVMVPASVIGRLVSLTKAAAR